nr:putative HNH homing endonuclease [Chloroidium sp. KL-2023a]
MNSKLKIPISLLNALVLETQEEAQEFYTSFIESLREKSYPQNIQLERHHVVPLHAGGPDVPENIIRISPEDHVAAHFYRFQAYKELGDKVAYEMRINDTNERARIRAQAAVFANKSKKQLFWDRDWQSVQGKKGGAAAGKANTPAQFLARQKVGLAHGKAVGLSNQSQALKFILSHSIEWAFKNEKGTFITPPVESAAAIVRELERLKPGNIRNASSFYKVLHGKREKMYGWTLVHMVISNEAGENEL